MSDIKLSKIYQRKDNELGFYYVNDPPNEDNATNYHVVGFAIGKPLAERIVAYFERQVTPDEDGNVYTSYPEEKAILALLCSPEGTSLTKSTCEGEKE